jgi:hypothetical protein
MKTFNKRKETPEMAKKLGLYAKKEEKSSFEYDKTSAKLKEKKHSKAI